MLEKGSSPRGAVLPQFINSRRTGNSSRSSKVEILKQSQTNEQAITRYKELVKVNYDATE